MERDLSTYLDLYPNRSMLFNPDEVGEYEWVNKIDLLSKLNSSMTSSMWEYISENDDLVSGCMSCMFYMTGSLSYNISYYNISKNKDFKDGEGFKFSFSNRFDFFSWKSVW